MEQNRETLLIVDDSKLQRAVFRQMLQKSFNLIEAANGDECLKLIEMESARIDMVLLDLVMPGIDGFEVLRRRKEMPAFREIPVIVLTTSEANEIQVEAFELGANEFIIKPVNPEVALSRINKVLESRRRMQMMYKRQEELQIKAEIDEMTQLLNKATTEKMITQVLETHPEEFHAMLAIDIDNFKAVNDLFGHKVGDHVISVVAATIASQFRKYDIVGRVGGDEFVVFMRNIDTKEIAYTKAMKILQLMEAKDNMSIPDNITVSIGLCFTGGKEKDYAALFKKADEALYCSKKGGKCRYTEYGVEKLEGASQNVYVWTGSRNVLSTIEYAFKHPVSVEGVKTLDELRDAVRKEPEKLLAVYVDVSDEADYGESIWSQLDEEEWAKQVPLIAVCKEGNLRQIRNAVLSDCLFDLLLAPIEPEQIKRRIQSCFKESE